MSWLTIGATHRCWAQLGARNSSDYSFGVNYTLYVNDQYPLCVDDAEPLFVTDEGRVP